MNVEITKIDIPELDKITLPNWLTFLDYSPIQKTEINELINNHIWITAYKTQIPVKQMSASHINNCIHCWNGKGKKKIPPHYLGGKEKWLKIFQQELDNRQ